MGLISSVYSRSSERPRSHPVLIRDELMLQTRQAIADVRDVPLSSVPKGWRKMAIYAADLEKCGATKSAKILDDIREQAGLLPAVRAWFRLNMGKGSE